MKTIIATDVDDEFDQSYGSEVSDDGSVEPNRAIVHEGDTSPLARTAQEEGNHSRPPKPAADEDRDLVLGLRVLQENEEHAITSATQAKTEIQKIRADLGERAYRQWQQLKKEPRRKGRGVRPWCKRNDVSYRLFYRVAFEHAKVKGLHWPARTRKASEILPVAECDSVTLPNDIPGLIQWLQDHVQPPLTALLMAKDKQECIRVLKQMCDVFVKAHFADGYTIVKGEKPMLVRKAS